MRTNPTRLDVSWEMIAAGLQRAERRRRGTRWRARALTPYRQATFVLAWLRHRGDVERLGAGLGLSRATAYRHRDKGISVLAAQAPDLAEVLAAAVVDQLPYLILDSIDRLDEKKTNRKGSEVDAWYSGKSRDFRANLQALMRPDEVPLWTSLVIPGSFHDIAAARQHFLDAIRHFLADLRSWPTRATSAQARASGSRSWPCPEPRNSAKAYAPTTGCCAGSDSRESVASPSKPATGKPCATSPSAPAASPTGTAASSYSSNSNTR